MSTYLDILGNPLTVGDQVIFTRYNKCSSLFRGKIVRETKEFFIVQELHTLPWNDEETCIETYDRNVKKRYTSFDLLKVS